MSEAPQPLAAVHYFYLLRSDQKDLNRLWSLLTAGAASVDSALPALNLAATLDESAPRCQVLRRIEGGATSFRLSLLADLSLVEISYLGGGKGLAESWNQAMEAIETDRDRLLSQVSGVFGETTVLIALAGTGLEAIQAAAAPATTAPVRALASAITPAASGANATLTTHIKPEIAGTEPALLVHFPRQSGGGRDYYAIAASDPSGFLAQVFPETDSLIKKLGRTATYFEEQRQTINSERSDVDREVGALLHRQVVAGGDGVAEAAKLEEQIATLSRLFGLLATDALLIRQASDRLSRDIKLLNQELKQIAEPGETDEIGAHYVGRFSLDLAEAHGERNNLDFSRQNAQAAIEVVRTQVEIMRAGEEAVIQQQSQEILSRSLVLQKERLSLQVAAGFIEFVLVFYYALKSWEGVVGMEPVEHMPPLLRLIVIGSFSASAAVGTHYLAHALQYHSWRSRGLWLSVVLLVLSLAAMVILSVAYS